MKAWLSGFVLCFAVGTISAAAAACPPQIRIEFPDAAVPPFLLGDGDAFADPPGLLVDWVRNALDRAGCAGVAQLSRRPSARTIHEIENGEQDIVAAFAATEDRMQVLAYPMAEGRPDPELFFAQSVLSLYTRGTETTVNWNGRELTATNPTVGVVRGQIEEFVSREHGWQTDVAGDPEQNIAKLRAGRIDVILQSEIEISLTASPADALRKLSPQVASVEFYAPVSPEFFAAYPDFTKAFWQALCREGRAHFKSLPACRR